MALKNTTDEKMLADIRDLIKTRGHAPDAGQADRAAVVVFEAVKRMQARVQKKWDEATPGPEGKKELDPTTEGQFLWTFAKDTIRGLIL